MRFAEEARARGLTRKEAAARVGVPEGTLAEWIRRERADGLASRAIGRPPTRPDRTTRQEILAFLTAEGPRVGLPTLQAVFPEVARRELGELGRRRRRVLDVRYRGRAPALEWTRVGATWAVDHTDAPSAIDGVYDKLLVVKDLASGEQLLAQPVEAADAATARDAVEALFVRHGAPLVLKSDNGSAFVEESFGATLARWNVLPLFSPRRCPRYNGACEAGIGSIKVRCEQRAARYGRPGYWTCDDVEAARQQANTTGRPRGPLQPTPEEAWSAREPIEPELRERLAASVERHLADVREELGLGRTPSNAATIDRREERSHRRDAIERALRELDLLRYRRGRITPRISR